MTTTTTNPAQCNGTDDGVIADDGTCETCGRMAAGTCGECDAPTPDALHNLCAACARRQRLQTTTTEPECTGVCRILIYSAVCRPDCARSLWLSVTADRPRFQTVSRGVVVYVPACDWCVDGGLVCAFPGAPAVDCPCTWGEGSK